MNEEQIKTVRMPKESWEKWEAALLSGKYKQTKGTLYDKVTGGYCCLGVLQHCLTGLVETDYEDYPLPMPSFEWLEERGIDFGDYSGFNVGKMILSAAPAVKTSSKHFKLVSEMNDDGESFADIVEAMRPHVETY